MITYEYHCLDCDEVFTRSERLSDHENAHPRCPKCGSEKVQQRFTTVQVQTGKKS